MIELGRKDLEIFKSNLISKRLTFKIVYKRSDACIVRSGKEVAKLVLSKNRIKISNEALSLFSHVKKSINKFIMSNNLDIEEIYQFYPAKFFNRILFADLEKDAEFTLIDVKHCYWRIAYLKGYIDLKLYESVINNQDPQYKLWRNMSLSCIIAPKKVQIFKNGKEFPIIEEDNTLYKKIYGNIRFTAWNLFGSICEKIGRENVIGYNTDGIMVFNEDATRVTSTLARNKLQYTVKKCRKFSNDEYITEKGKIYKL